MHSPRIPLAPPKARAEKGGLMMGTKKVGASAGPLTKARLILTQGGGIQKEILMARPAQAPCIAGGIAVESD